MDNTPNTLPWTWDRSGREPRLVLIDQDQVHRATMVTTMDLAGLLFYCVVLPHVHEPLVLTTKSRSPTLAMQEAETMLLDAGVEI